MLSGFTSSNRSSSSRNAFSGIPKVWAILEPFMNIGYALKVNWQALGWRDVFFEFEVNLITYFR